MAQVSITLPDQLKEDMDRYSKKNSLQRSELIRHLIRVEVYHEKSLERKNGGENHG